MSATEWSELIRNYVLTFAALVGSFTALFGLFTWKRQKVWEQDFDLAQRYVATLLRYRDKVVASSLPHANHKEPYQIEFYVDDTPPPENTDFEVATIVAELSDQAVEAKSEIDAVQIEAQAIWGDKPKSLLGEVFELHAELQYEIQLFVIEVDPRETEAGRKDANRYRRETRGILLRHPDKPKVDLQQELNNALNPAMQFLGSILGRSHR